MKVIYSGLLCSQYGEGLCDPLVVDSHLVHQLFSLDGVELLEDRCFIEYDWDVGMLGSILCDCVEVNVFMDVVKRACSVGRARSLTRLMVRRVLGSELASRGHY